MSTHKNRVKMTISGTPGTGTITLSAASSGYQSFATAYGANATVDILIEEGTSWEVARDCTYTNSGTTVTRGTLEASSTGSAVSFTSAAVVSVIATADRGRTWDAAALNTQVTGTDADTTMAVNTLYVVDMSAWATADRTYTLPATAAVGDRCAVMVTAGDDSHELILTAGTGDTLNGIAGGAEWSRLFITNEVVIMRCIVANATWVVEQDGRIPQVGSMRLSTSADGETALTFTRPTQAPTPGAWTADVDVGSVCSTSGDQIKTRRAGRFNFYYVGLIKDLLTDQQYHGASIFFNGTANILHAATMYASGVQAQSSTGVIFGYSMAAGDYIVYQYRTQAGSLGLSSTSLPRIGAGFGLVEVLP